ncbi:MAG: hypothetical protein ACK4NC_07290 [Candidatus Gracilibacteria bacterium]
MPTTKTNQTLEKFIEYAKGKNFLEYLLELENKNIEELNDYDLFFIENIHITLRNSIQTKLSELIENTNIIAQAQDTGVLLTYYQDFLGSIKNENDAFVFEYLSMLSVYVSADKVKDLSLFDACLLITKLERKEGAQYNKLPLYL